MLVGESLACLQCNSTKIGENVLFSDVSLFLALSTKITVTECDVMQCG